MSSILDALNKLERDKAVQKALAESNTLVSDHAVRAHLLGVEPVRPAGPRRFFWPVAAGLTLVLGLIGGVTASFVFQRDAVPATATEATVPAAATSIATADAGGTPAPDSEAALLAPARESESAAASDAEPESPGPNDAATADSVPAEELPVEAQPPAPQPSEPAPDPEPDTIDLANVVPREVPAPAASEPIHTEAAASEPSEPALVDTPPTADAEPASTPIAPQLVAQASLPDNDPEPDVEPASLSQLSEGPVELPAPPMEPAPIPQDDTPLAPDAIRQLPPLRGTERIRFGLETMKLNMVSEPTPRSPDGWAVINLGRVYAGEVIPGTRAKLIGVARGGIAIEVSGQRYFLEL